ncbi:class I SAM-dependent methyltransferase [Rickettsia amblyommatis]|nr:class I SAM-dependent methyltransferase [Rickettsia amblyommatis]
MMKNIQYYNNNAQEFYSRTINADLSDNYKAFTSYLPEQAHILDAGCGVGRDTKYFLSQRYQVTAFDGSTEMVKLATKETGIDVLHSTFQDIDFKESFDGVWAQATLLHVPIMKQSMCIKNSCCIKAGRHFLCFLRIQFIYNVMIAIFTICMKIQ